MDKTTLKCPAADLFSFAIFDNCIHYVTKTGKYWSLHCYDIAKERILWEGRHMALQEATQVHFYSSKGNAHVFCLVPYDNNDSTAKTYKARPPPSSKSEDIELILVKDVKTRFKSNKVNVTHTNIAFMSGKYDFPSNQEVNVKREWDDRSFESGFSVFAHGDKFRIFTFNGNRTFQTFFGERPKECLFLSQSTEFRHNLVARKEINDFVQSYVFGDKVLMVSSYDTLKESSSTQFMLVQENINSTDSFKNFWAMYDVTHLLLPQLGINPKTPIVTTQDDEFLYVKKSTSNEILKLKIKDVDWNVLDDTVAGRFLSKDQLSEAIEEIDNMYLVSVDRGALEEEMIKLVDRMMEVSAARQKSKEDLRRKFSQADLLTPSEHKKDVEKLEALNDTVFKMKEVYKTMCREYLEQFQ